jgi:hypothetical protein
LNANEIATSSAKGGLLAMTFVMFFNKPFQSFIFFRCVVFIDVNEWGLVFWKRGWKKREKKVSVGLARIWRVLLAPAGYHHPV